MNSKRIVVVFAAFALAVVGLNSWAGDLDPPPGPVTPTMTTMDELLNAIEAVPSGPEGPQGPQGPAGTATPFTNDPLFAGVDLTPAPVSIYMSIVGDPGEPIPGESTAPGYVGSIDVENATVQLGRDVSIGPGGVFSGKQWEPIRILARLDSSLPRLMQKAAEAEVLQTVEITFVRDTPTGPVEYLTYFARGSVITNIYPLANYDLYVLELAFACIRVEYTPITDPPSAPITFSWIPGSMSADCPP